MQKMCLVLCFKNIFSKVEKKKNWVFGMTMYFFYIKNECFMCCQHHIGPTVFKVIITILLKIVNWKLKTLPEVFLKYGI